MTQVFTTDGITKQKRLMLKELWDMVVYYGTDPSRRAVDTDGNCTYHDEHTGNMCAVGRRMTQEGRDAYGHTICDVDVLCDVYLRMGENNHLSDNQVLASIMEVTLPVGFWMRLQQLHDSCMNWDHIKGGLSVIGKRQLSAIFEWVINQGQ